MGPVVALRMEVQPHNPVNNSPNGRKILSPLRNVVLRNVLRNDGRTEPIIGCVEGGPGSRRTSVRGERRRRLPLSEVHRHVIV